mmetsp:Transcript_2808/g.4836  ORF Transcript_2808/g.4836 Transcript_2808/m.4836 type:complete len:602 (+) Transcript_2808:106-1911(+)
MTRFLTLSNQRWMMLLLLPVLDTTSCMALQSMSFLTTRTAVPTASSRNWRCVSSSCLFYQVNNNNNNGGSGNEPPEEDSHWNNNNDDEESSSSSYTEAAAFHRHMAKVRSLQLSYYTTSTSHIDNPKKASCKLESATGRLLQLPVYPTTSCQLPGRSNVFEITDPVYTNMFESILYKPQPWCFGHVVVEEEENESSASSFSSSSSNENDEMHNKLGCLMHIADYRRMADGRLILLVHAMERFVTTQSVQQLPYRIIHAQVLPDVEEIDPQLVLDANIREDFLQQARAMAIQESVRYHSYEYDPHHSFSSPSSSETSTTATANLRTTRGRKRFYHDQLLVKDHSISPATIAKVLPFCPFSKTMDPPPATSTTEPTSRASPTATTSSSSSSSSPCLEYQLLQRGILNIPPTDPDFYMGDYRDVTTEQIEVKLWLLINQFLITTKQPVSPVLLSLLPPPSNELSCSSGSTTGNGRSSSTNNNDNNTEEHKFVLHKIANDLKTKTKGLEHDFVPVPPDQYPAYRRQRRLSFSAAYLLEEYYDKKQQQQEQQQKKESPSSSGSCSIPSEAEELKALLLSIPSTKQRLRVLLEKFLQWQQQEWGELQ